MKCVIPEGRLSVAGTHTPALQNQRNLLLYMFSLAVFTRCFGAAMNGIKHGEF